MKKTFLSILLIMTLLVSLTACSGKTVKFDYFDGKFSPFFALTSSDMSVNSMLQETLLVTVEETSEKKLDAYTKGVGIADITIDDADKTKLVCTIKIGDDVTFSDGTPMTADDVIFSMYVYADTDYEGWSAFGLSEIDGLKNYRYNNSLAENIRVTEEQLDKALASPDEQLKTLLREKIIHPILEEEMEWVKRVYNDSAYVGTEIGKYMGIYPEAKDLFAYLYSIDKTYDSKTATDCDQVLETIKKQYDWNYRTLSLVVGEIDLTSAARRCAEEVVTKNLLAASEGGEPVDTIRGIEKVDDKTVRVTINSQEDEQFTSVTGIYVAPLHHYGDISMYDYQNAKFGFTRGDLSAIREKNTTPLGAGKYTLKDCKELKTVSFAKNKNYFTNADVKSRVTFKATGNSSESKMHDYYVTYENYTAK